MQVEEIVSTPIPALKDDVEYENDELVEDFMNKVDAQIRLKKPPPATPTTEKWFLYGPVFNRDNTLVQRTMKHNPEFTVTVEKLLETKPTNLEGIKRTAKMMMTILLQAFEYLVLPVAVVALTFVVVGVYVGGHDFSIRSPDGFIFDIDATWFASDVGGTDFASIETVHVLIDGVAYPPWPTMEGLAIPVVDGTFVFSGGRFYRVPPERMDTLRAMVTTASSWVEAARASAEAAHSALRRSAFGVPAWLTAVDYSSLAATSTKMVLVLIAGPITFLLGLTATVSAATLPSVLLVLQPLLVTIDLLIDTYSGIYPLDEFPRFYKERIHKVWDNYTDTIGSIPESVVENVKAMVDAVS
jgi:hypothetical protein